MTSELLFRLQPELLEAYHNDPIIHQAFRLLDNAKTIEESNVIIAKTLFLLSKEYRSYRKELIDKMNLTAWDGNRKD